MTDRPHFTSVFVIIAVLGLAAPCDAKPGGKKKADSPQVAQQKRKLAGLRKQLAQNKARTGQLRKQVEAAPKKIAQVDRSLKEAGKRVDLTKKAIETAEANAELPRKELKDVQTELLGDFESDPDILAMKRELNGIEIELEEIVPPILEKFVASEPVRELAQHILGAEKFVFDLKVNKASAEQIKAAEAEEQRLRRELARMRRAAIDADPDAKRLWPMAEALRKRLDDLRARHLVTLGKQPGYVAAKKAYAEALDEIAAAKQQSAAARSEHLRLTTRRRQLASDAQRGAAALKTLAAQRRSLEGQIASNERQLRQMQKSGK